MKKFLVYVAVVVGLPSVSMAQQTGFYGLRDYLTASSITDDGRVFLWRGQSPTFEALWTPSSLTPFTLGVQDTGIISSNGQFIAFTGAGGSFRYRVSDGVRDSVPPPLGEANPNARVRGISGDGSVIAGFDSSTTSAFRWSAATGSVRIDTPEGGYAEAFDVSDDGKFIVGVSSGQGFISQAGQPVQIVQSLAPDLHTQFRSISRDNRVVVGGAFSGGGLDAAGPAFKWTADEGYINLGSISALPEEGPQNYMATAMTLDATIIAGDQGGRRAWIWDQESGMRDLKTVLTDVYHYDVSNWTLGRVNDISPDGTIIAGDGEFFNGQAFESRAWVAIIPTPGPLCAASVMAGLLMARGRRR